MSAPSVRPSTFSKKKELTVLILSEDTTHVVVEFRNCGRSSFALVVATWLTSGKKDWYCQYPKGVEMECVPQYVQAGINPREDWPKYKVKIVQEASNYEQGKRRFNRLLEGENASISDLHSMDQLPNPDRNGDGHELSVIENSDKNRKNDSDTTKSLSTEEAGNSDSEIDEQVSDSRSEGSDNSTASRSASPEIRRAHKPTENVKSGKAKVPAAAERQHHRQLEPNAVTKEEVGAQMKKMQEAICKKIDTLKKSWINELRHQFQELAASVTPSENFRAVGEALNTCERTLETNFPVEEKLEFLKLEAALVEEGEKYKALKTYMKLLQNGSKTLKDSVAQILSALLSKSQQLSFSGSGRVTNGKGKENFSATKMFKAMSELLIEIHSCSSAEVRSKTGKWLAGAGDRNGGKKERMLKALSNE